MARKELKYISDQQPTGGHVLPQFAQDPELLSKPSQQMRQRFTGKPRRSTDGTIGKGGKTFEVQSLKQVDVFLLSEQGGENVLFYRTSDALAQGEETGFDPRDYQENPLTDAEEIDKANVIGPQLSTIKHGASRKHIPAGQRDATRIKGVLPTK